jgi:hypothetical protein
MPFAATAAVVTALVSERSSRDHSWSNPLDHRFIFSIPIIWTLGIIAIVIGVILALVGMAGNGVGGRRFWW